MGFAATVKSVFVWNECVNLRNLKGNKLSNCKMCCFYVIYTDKNFVYHKGISRSMRFAK